LNRRQVAIGIRAVPACTPVGAVAHSLISNEIIDVEAGQEITPPVDGDGEADTKHAPGPATTDAEAISNIDRCLHNEPGGCRTR
jgi:hypothetical protein